MCSFTLNSPEPHSGCQGWEPPLRLLGSGTAGASPCVGWLSLSERLHELKWGKRGKEERLGFVPSAVAAASPVSSALSPCPAGCPLSRPRPPCPAVLRGEAGAARGCLSQSAAPRQKNTMPIASFPQSPALYK